MTEELTVDTDRTTRLRHVLWTFARRAVVEENVRRRLVEQTEAALSRNRRLGGRDGAVRLLARRIVDHYQASPRACAPQGAAVDPVDPVRGSDVPHPMERALAALPPFERLAVLLCDVERLNRRSACEVLGCSRARLAFLVACGRNRLRRALEDR